MLAIKGGILSSYNEPALVSYDNLLKFEAKIPPVPQVHMGDMSYMYAPLDYLTSFMHKRIDHGLTLRTDV